MPTMLLAPLLVGAVACIGGMALLLGEPQTPPKPQPHPTSVPPPTKSARPTTTPVTVLLQGAVLRFDVHTGTILVRAQGATYSIHLAPTTSYAAPCVTPAALAPGLSLAIQLNTYINGQMNALSLAPGPELEPNCAPRPTTLGTPTALVVRATPQDTNSVIPPLGDSGAETDQSPPHP